MIDVILNVMLAQKRVLKAQLQVAKDRQRHNDITPLSTQLSQLEARIQARLRGTT